MGGNNETKICGLRFHENDGFVHIHDDSKSLKYESETDIFKEDINDAFEALKNNEGIVKISSNKNDLYILKQGRNISVFLMDNSSVKQKLEKFMRAV